MKTAIDFLRIPVCDASKDQLAEATTVVNEANAAFERIFPNLRLQPNEIESDYQDYLLVLAVESGEVHGTMALIVRDMGLKVELLAVSPQAQGRDLGSKLIEVAVDVGLERSLDTIWLEAVDRGRLVGYYLRLGFSEKARRRMPAGHWSATEPFDLVTFTRAIAKV